MMPRTLTTSQFVCRAIVGLVCVLPFAGCTSPLLVSPASELSVDVEAIEADLGSDVHLVRDVTSPQGTNHIILEGEAIVTNLKDTGSDPPPSAQRSTMIADMQGRDVKKPNAILASPTTSLVLVRTALPPGVRKGDRLDVEVRVPKRSETTSLRNAWLMETRLREVAVLDRLRTGRTEALAEGQVILDEVFQGDEDDMSQLRGRVLGGGVSLTSRPLGLAVRSENHSVKTASVVGAAINSRFHTRQRGVKRGVATPKRDNFIELEIHPRYKNNLARYIRVVQSIAVAESAGERVQRMELLERKLLEPTTSAAAALQLEAIGKEAVAKLERGLVSEDPEVRFYAAEALAYLDGADAAEPLAEAAKNEPAFRWHAIAALAVLDHPNARDALADLLHVQSAETRYAAFRALHTRNPADPLARGEQLGDQLSYHTISTSGPPMIHFSRSKRPEIVVFGTGQRLVPPGFLYAGKNIMLKAAGPDRIKVIRFDVKEEDQQQYCSSRLEDVVQTIVKTGGGYAEVLQCLHEAQRREYLDARVVVDALPRPGRVYRRENAGDGGPVQHAGTPLPEMFANLLYSDDKPTGKDDSDWEDDWAAMGDARKEDEGFLKQMGSWFYDG
ncbi:MAG: flagellar basal body P-ring protein FlgI [Pirellulaceae bacterium]|nr:flagellar basal body P-ring protein FlgI [Pirellulaceae bacterium]